MKELKTLIKQRYAPNHTVISQIIFEMLEDEQISFSDICSITLAPDPTVKDRWFVTITYLYQEDEN